MADNQKFERVFLRQENFDRKLYMLNEEVTSIKQRLTTIKESAENEVIRQMTKIEKEIEKNMMRDKRNESHYKNKF